MALKPGRIDAVLAGRDAFAGKSYFFRGGSYVRYDWAADRVDAGFPASIAAWGLTGDFLLGIDAALNGDGPFAGKAYFFRGDQYVRYDWATDRIDPDYPASIAAWKLPGAFASGVDAGWDGHAPHPGKGYFIRGGQYVRYDWAADRPDPGYPQPLSARALPAPLNIAVSAVANGQDGVDGKAYFFGVGPDRRSALYGRYDWTAEKGDPGYPLPVVGQWSGLVEALDVGPAKELALLWQARASQVLTDYAARVAGNITDAVTALVEPALLTHFHLDRSSFAAQAPTIVGNYAKVRAALLDSEHSLRIRNADEARADLGVDPSGTPYPCYTFFNGSINVTETFTQFGPLCQAAMILHEPMHYVDRAADTANDFYEHGAAYPTISAGQAVHNPSSYVCFAEQVFYGSDVRYGAGRSGE